MENIAKELLSLAQSIPPESLERCAAQLASHERIFVCGAGRSGLMLKALAMRLMQLGKTAYAAGETTTPAIGPGDLLVAASASGSTPSVCRNVRIALDCGSDVMILTARSHSPLTELHPADLLQPAPTKDEPGVQLMGSLFEQGLLLVCDTLVSRLPYDADAMRMRHANLE